MNRRIASASVPHGPFRALEEKKISPDEYAQRVRREVHERIRETPAPSRKPDKALPPED